jgi:pterin-4a-carbinolamine dehydratase
MKGQISYILEDYFDEVESTSCAGILNESVFSFSTCTIPVQPIEPSSWEIVSDPNRFMKKYEFESFATLKSFVDEILDYQESIQHHAKLTVEHRTIIIEVYTHDVNDITELDQEYTKSADEIYLDILDYAEGHGELTYDIKL